MPQRLRLLASPSMPSPALSSRSHSVRARLTSFLAERFPFALPEVLTAYDRGPADFLEVLPAVMRDSLRQSLGAEEIPETTPGVSAAERIGTAIEEIVEACRGFLRREEISASLTRTRRSVRC